MGSFSEVVCGLIILPFCCCETEAELIEAMELMELCLDPIAEEVGVANDNELPLPVISYEAAASSMTCSMALSGNKSGLVVTRPNFCITSSIEASSDNIPISSSITGFKEATRLQYLCLSSEILHKHILFAVIVLNLDKKIQKTNNAITYKNFSQALFFLLIQLFVILIEISRTLFYLPLYVIWIRSS